MVKKPIQSLFEDHKQEGQQRTGPRARTRVSQRPTRTNRTTRPTTRVQDSSFRPRFGISTYDIENTDSNSTYGIGHDEDEFVSGIRSNMRDMISRLENAD